MNILLIVIHSLRLELDFTKTPTHCATKVNACVDVGDCKFCFRVEPQTCDASLLLDPKSELFSTCIFVIM